MVLSQISRAFSYRDRTTFIRLYKSYVRPHLEFSSPAWRPWLQKDIQLLEKVQMRAVKMVGGLQGLTYKDKLTELILQSLESRRKEADLLLMSKVMHGTCKVNSERWKTARQNGGLSTQTAADATRLTHRRGRLDIRRKSYVVRVAEEWNQLPQEIQELTTVSRFKPALHNHKSAHAAGTWR